MSITIEVERRDGWDVVGVTGEIDIRTAPELRDRLAGLIDGGSERVIMDLAQVDFLDSTALSVMVGAHKRLARTGESLRIVSSTDAVLRVLSVTGLSRVFAVHDTLDAALAPPA